MLVSNVMRMRYIISNNELQESMRGMGEEGKEIAKEKEEEKRGGKNFYWIDPRASVGISKV